MLRARLRPTALAVVLLLAAGCAGGEPRDQAVEQPPAAAEAAPRPPLPPLETFAREGLRPIGSTRAEIAARLGEPDSVVARAVPNRHVPGVTDTLFTLHYPAAVVGIHTPGGGRDLISAVTVTDDRHLRTPILGATRAEVEAGWGEPGAVRDGWWVYHCGSCGEADSPLEIAFSADDRVRAVRFNYYVD